MDADFGTHRIRVTVYAAEILGQPEVTAIDITINKDIKSRRSAIRQLQQSAHRAHVAIVIRRVEEIVDINSASGLKSELADRLAVDDFGPQCIDLSRQVSRPKARFRVGPALGSVDVSAAQRKVLSFVPCLSELDRGTVIFGILPRLLGMTANYAIGFGSG